MPSDARLVPAPGFTPDLGVLVSMLEATRKTTLDAVRGLAPAQLEWSSRYRGWTLDQHLALLAQVREDSLQRLAQCDDAWLDQEFTLIEGTRVNFRWAWFHVFEDELSHRGQVLLIRNHLLPAFPSPVG
ncbi:DUF664 domain-containing protein [Deinococcus enclensis]|uniref:Damage-inducible protein DinB n=1 Tax=Deinococcus enclensis TaxID=1049582 RepID=A0ABT9MET8_9DEIO|nr:DUF664 domain-containing protein [Deinococcus enclensis]MDP9765117.1 putative damage-inducible protein DinB [Deinococcus enclensis]